MNESCLTYGHVQHMNGPYFVVQKCNHVTRNHVMEMRVQCIANVCIVMYQKRVYNVCQDLRIHQASGIKFLVKFSDTAAPKIVLELQFRVQVSDLNGTRQLKVSDPNS